MKAFLVTLNFRTRNALPKIGNFIYSDKHRRYAWKGEEITDAGTLAEYVNEALTFIETLHYDPLIVRVFPFELDTPQEETSISNETGNEEPSRPRGRPKKLLTAA
jgi:hypothetical protein